MEKLLYRLPQAWVLCRNIVEPIAFATAPIPATATAPAASVDTVYGEKQENSWSAATA
jgi:hypothetical protein